jgi:HK97 family phage prohead protease
MKDAKRPPREGLFRARPESPQLRAADDPESDRPVIFGHFARFNEWTKIDSAFEGTFMELIAPGAFDKTFSENRDNIRLLFQHGRDPQVGDKPLGTLRELREDDEGAYYEAELFDTSYNRDLEPGLRAGAYGASFAFSVVREDFDREPERSDRNPDGIPERTVREARVYEGGPVTFPAYDGATAGVRSVSLTDQVMIARATNGDPERLREFAEFFQRSEEVSEEVEPAGDTPLAEDEISSDAPPETDADETVTSEEGRRAATTPEVHKWTFKSEQKGWQLP